MVLQALAEACLQKQKNLVSRTLDWCRVMSAEETKVQMLAFILHRKHAETALKARAVPAAHKTAKDVVIGKVHVVEQRWTVLFKEHRGGQEHYYLVTSSLAPQSRTSDCLSAEAITAVLRHTIANDDPAAILRSFPLGINITECDANGANLKAQRILEEGSMRGWLPVVLECQAHKIHASFTKVLSLPIAVELVSGMKHLNLFLSAAGKLGSFRAELAEHISRSLVVEHGSFLPLSQEAVHYRRQVLAAFAPAGKRAAKTVSRLLEMLSSDWRSKNPTHRCGPGCCKNIKESAEKVNKALQDLMKVASPRIRWAQNNWLEWPRAWSFGGMFLGCHSLLQAVLPKVLGPGVVHEGQMADLDEMERWRLEMSRHRRSCLNLLCRPHLLDELHILRMALQPEHEMMQATLSEAGSKWQVQQMMQMHDTGTREYSLVNMHLGKHSGPMLQQSWGLLATEDTVP